MSEENEEESHKENKSVRIMHVGMPIIRAHAKRIENMQEAARICEILVEKLNELQGAGLAAPQVGIPYRIFVAEVRKTEMFPDREETPLHTMINPEFEILWQEEESDFEGCFSVPGYVGIVPRFRKLHAKWTQPDGSKREQIFEGYLARVLQHEMDHLNGMVYLDRMTDMSTLSTRENYMRARLEHD